MKFAILFSILLSVFVNRVLCTDPILMYESLITQESSKEIEEMTTYRLPNNTVPLSYTLRIVPHLEDDFGFDGEVSILIKAKEASNTITLHSKDLDIKSAQIIYKDSIKFFPVVTMDSKNQMLKVKSQIDLVANTNYTVIIQFNGTLQNYDMLGFYRSSYKIGNTTKWLASTQFEPIFARTAFPCYDEPGYRTPFNIHIARYAHQRAISNMRKIWTSPPDADLDNRVWDTFDTTPAMPTYLVAFIVCEFGYASDAARYVSVYIRENAVDYIKYALETGTKMLKQMEVETGLRYLLPKLDLAGIPDFQAGAMENWGLTTYRERFIIYNKNLTSAENKQMSTTVIAHEIAHQWFGDYITPIWWNYIWLNEGFATYFQSVLVSRVEPSWRMDEFFVIDVLHNALFTDELAFRHALTTTVSTPTEIMGTFDGLTYWKGASILRMLEHVVSSSTFFDSLHLYLQKGHDIGSSVTPEILWAAFDEKTKLNNTQLPENLTVQAIMETWTNQRGYPLISVRRITNDDNLTSIVIKQRTYNSTNGIRSTTPNSVWIVPLSYMQQSSNSSSTRPTIWSTSQQEITLTNITKIDEWILFNVNQTGYYRVNYDNKNWELLIQQLYQDFRSIPPLNRAQLIDDSYNLAIDGNLACSTPFTLLMYLDYENDPIPIQAAVKSLNYIYFTYGNTSRDDGTPEIWSYTTERIKPHFHKLGFSVPSGDSHVNRTLRTNIVKFSCQLGIGTCTQNATNEFKTHKKNLTNLHPDTRETVLCVAFKTDSSEETWNHVWKLYHTSNIPQVKESIIVAAGCSKNSTLLKKYLNKLLLPDKNDTEIRMGDLSQAFKAVFTTHLGVSTGLIVLNDSISTMLNHTGNDTNKRLDIFMTFIKSQIRTTDHFEKLDSILTALKKLKQERFVKLAALLESIKKEANETCLYQTKIKANLVDALKSLPETPTVDPNPHTDIKSGSPATVSIPYSIVLYFSLVVVSLCIPASSISFKPLNFDVV